MQYEQDEAEKEEKMDIFKKCSCFMKRNLVKIDLDFIYDRIHKKSIKEADNLLIFTPRGLLFQRQNKF